LYPTEKTFKLWTGCQRSWALEFRVAAKFFGSEQRVYLLVANAMDPQSVFWSAAF